jgi:predicted PilT family ATPase
MNDSADNKKRRQLTNAEVLGGNLKELIDQDKVSIYSLPMLTKAIEQYNKLGQKEAEPLEDTCGIWIYGPKGVGKSHYARTSLGY